jgi:hypothetical protein
MVITRRDVKDKARCEILVDMKLDEMGISERENGPEIETAAKAYYLELLQDHLDNSDDIIFDGYFDDSEGLVLGFVAGYEACLKARRLAT